MRQHWRWDWNRRHDLARWVIRRRGKEDGTFPSSGLAFFPTKGEGESFLKVTPLCFESRADRCSGLPGLPLQSHCLWFFLPSDRHPYRSLHSCLCCRNFSFNLTPFFIASTSRKSPFRKTKASFRNVKRIPRLLFLDVNSDKVYSVQKTSLKSDVKNLRQKVKDPLAQAKGTRWVTRWAYQSKLGDIMIGILWMIHEIIDWALSLCQALVLQKQTYPEQSC